MTPDEAKRYAAVCYALGWARSMLHDVLNGEVDKERLEKVYEATATMYIAEAIGSKEAEFFPDWDSHLSRREKWRISGRSEDRG